MARSTRWEIRRALALAPILLDWGANRLVAPAAVYLLRNVRHTILELEER
jgi:hypothetical protein